MSKEMIVLNVEGMSCSHCEKRVQTVVGELNGVESVAVSLADKTVTVSYDSELVDLKLLKEAIEDQGYDVL